MLETIWKAILPYVLEIILAIISIIIARYVIPFIKNDVIPWLKEKKLYSTVKKFVQAVEKLAESGAIDKKDKNEKVVEFLQSKGIVVDSTVKAFIESAVKELDMAASVIVNEIMEADCVIDKENQK